MSEVEDQVLAVDEKVEIPEKYNTDDYAYLQNEGYTSEIFKIEVKNLPKYYGFGEIKKLFSKTLGIESHKIKIPSRNSPYGYICLKNDEGETFYIFIKKL